MSIEQSRESDSSGREQQQLLKDTIFQIETKLGKLPAEKLQKLGKLSPEELWDFAANVNSQATTFDMLQNSLKSQEYGQFAAILSDKTQST